MKHPKLIGADVYVMRLARPCLEPSVRKKPHNSLQQMDNVQHKRHSGTYSTPSDLSPPTGSLHDELSCKTKEPDPPIAKLENVEVSQFVSESRPCYRCISYMQSVGIKRVFWTNCEGNWEGAKVRDLVDQLEGAMDSSDNSSGLPVFITKHEVLLLRRLMSGGE